MAESCETCRFGVYSPRREFRDCPGLTCAAAQVMCRRHPEPLRKRPEDWCGEYQPKETPQ